MINDKTKNGIKPVTLQDVEVTPEDRILFEETAQDLANSSAPDGNGKAYIDGLKVAMQSTNPRIRNAAVKAAGDFTTDLTLLTLNQKLVAISDFGYMDIVETFYDGELSVGNTKQYILKALTGKSTYDRSKFTPTDVTLPLIDVTNISFFKNTAGELADGSFQFKKSLSILSAE
ncbi:MAG: hypothetical protein ACRCXY_11375 [Fusobacteriaceae bacterium]